MSRTYSAMINALWVGLTVGISDIILETLEVQSKLIKGIVIFMAVYIILTIVEKYKIYKTKSINIPK